MMKHIKGEANMKRIILSSLIVSVLLSTSCSLYWDGMIASDYLVQHIVFEVEPDYANILLNGRFIGETFEFSTPESALRLRSKRHEIIIKKKGYIEEVVDLNQYHTRHITIRLTMKKDPGIITEEKEKPAAPEKEKPEYIAKTEPQKKPVEPIPQKQQTPEQMVEVRFEIEPPDAAIYLNGKFWGIAPASGKIENLRLPGGTHTIQVVKPGYAGIKKVISLKGQKQVTVTIKLEEKEKNDALIL